MTDSSAFNSGPGQADVAAGEMRRALRALSTDQFIAALRDFSGGNYLPEDSDELMAEAAERLEEVYSGKFIIVPKSLDHARSMNLVSQHFINQAPAAPSDKDQG